LEVYYQSIVDYYTAMAQSYNITFADFLMAKYRLQRSELSKQQIENRLKLKQVDAATIQRLLKVIDECEFAKFAPASDEGGLKNLLNEVKDIMRSL
jgi:hypothetical protein